MDEVLQHLRNSKRCLFITGAGISADSGLPTYRGVGGIYAEADTEDGVPIEEALSGRMFKRDPAVTWRYVSEIERACRGAVPNRAHEVIAALESRMEVVVLTQNVDGLHLDAGSSRVIEIHGNLRRLMCPRCTWKEVVSDYSTVEASCPRCGVHIRPDVVLFGEMLPELAMAKLRRSYDKPFDLVFSIGTTSVFPYIAEPVLLAARMGVPAVEVNPGDTRVSAVVSHRIREGAAAALGRLYDAL